MSRIRILPENVANKIAAGEVVERPASVVKELLENALDAGARSIRIEVESGGKRLIRITDDGCGMNHDDALLAFERHATSKLRTADDLLSITTLGFRGEALPSIAAISRLVLETHSNERNGESKTEPISEIKSDGAPEHDPKHPSTQLLVQAAVPAPVSTTPADQEQTPENATEKGTEQTPEEITSKSRERTAENSQGIRIEFAGGKLFSVKPAGVPAGTSISVSDIFYCVPARRKFLKSETTELGHIASLVTHYALAHPECQFVLKTPSQEILNCPPVEKLADRVYQVFGRQALDELMEIPANESPMRSAITEPQLEADELASKIRVSGFTSRPEVQRTNRNGIYIFVNRRLVRDRLLLHAISEAYRNIMPPGVFPLVLLFLEIPYQEVDVNVHPAKIEVRFRHPQFVHDFTRDSIRHALSIARPIPGFPAVRAAAAGVTPGSAASPLAESSNALNASAAQPFSAPGYLPGPPRAVIPSDFLISGPRSGYESAVGSESFELSGALDRPIPQRLGFAPSDVMDFPVTQRTITAPLAETAVVATEATPGSLPHPEEIADLKPLGQVNSSFIIAVNNEGLWIIDQHVAHERVLFEQHLRARREGEIGGQRLLMPLIVELNPRQLATFEQIGPELAANGFEAGLMGTRSVAIQAAPAGIASGDAEKLLFEILDGIARENQAISIDSLQAKIAASTSCHAAIKVNTPLDTVKMEWLLGELAKTEYPMSCPHGRPVVLRYSVREIERAFKRI